jgi:hypothetical protein
MHYLDPDIEIKSRSTNNGDTAYSHITTALKEIDIPKNVLDANQML